jgi:hypothetical protein
VIDPLDEASQTPDDPGRQGSTRRWLGFALLLAIVVALLGGVVLVLVGAISKTCCMG